MDSDISRDSKVISVATSSKVMIGRGGSVKEFGSSQGVEMGSVQRGKGEGSLNEVVNPLNAAKGRKKESR